MKFLLPYKKGSISEKYVYYFQDLEIDRKYYKEIIEFKQLNIDEYNEKELREIFLKYDYILLRNQRNDEEFKEEIFKLLSKFKMKEKKLNFRFVIKKKEKKGKIYTVYLMEKTYYEILKKIGNEIEKDCYNSNVFKGGIEYKKIPLLDKYKLYHFPILEDSLKFTVDHKTQLIKDMKIKLETLNKPLNQETNEVIISKKKEIAEKYYCKLEILQKQLKIALENLKLYESR